MRSALAHRRFGASLDRNGNLNALSGAIIAENGPGRNNAVANRGQNSDLYFGLAGNVADSFTVGIDPGVTSWKGISSDSLGDRTLANGSVVTAASDFNLHSINGRKLILGSSGGGVTINGAVNAHIRGVIDGPLVAGVSTYVQLAGTSSNFNGVNFDIHEGSTLELVNSTALGTAANLGRATVERGGLLKVSNATAANGNVNVLLLRLEDMNETAPAAIGEFLVISPVDIITTNVAAGKSYGALYQRFIERLELPVEYLDRLYQSRFSTHFYTAAEIDSFRAGWLSRLEVAALTRTESSLIVQ